MTLCSSGSLWKLLVWRRANFIKRLTLGRVATWFSPLPHATQSTPAHSCDWMRWIHSYKVWTTRQPTISIIWPRWMATQLSLYSCNVRARQAYEQYVSYDHYFTQQIPLFIRMHQERYMVSSLTTNIWLRRMTISRWMIQAVKDNVYQKGINCFLDKTSLAVARSYPRFVRYNFVRFIVRYLLPK